MNNINSNFIAGVYNNALNSATASKTSKGDKVNVTELTEKEKLEVFKKEVWKEIDGMPWNKSVNISIQVTDGAFKRMMEEPEFKNKMLSMIREESIAARSPINVSLTWIDEKGYSGYSYLEGGETAFSTHSKNKDSLYAKKAEMNKDSNKLWEEKMLEKKMQQKKMNKKYYENLLEKRRLNQKENMVALYDRNVTTLYTKDV